MKKLYLFSLLIWSCFALTAQNQNGIDVRNFISPISGFNYDTNATEAITIRFSNDGPNDLFAQDSIEFSVTIGYGTSTEFYTIKKRVGVTLYPGDRVDYVLIPNYRFSVENSYTICVTAEGTNAYPTNLTKNARSCVSFLVNLEEKAPDISKVLYHNQKLSFQLEQAFKGNVLIYDLTGKRLFNQKMLLNKNHSLDFNSPAKGVYFLQLISDDGKRSIAKFVAH